MLNKVVIDKENLELAIEVQNKIFPNFSAKTNYTESVNGLTTNIYYLIFKEQECIGISGIYHYDVDKTSAWLGWFGVLSEYRNKGYGSEILRLFEKEAFEAGYEHVRIYTDKYDNDSVLNFYEKNGYIYETYDNLEDSIISKYPIVIFSKNIKNTEFKYWNNKNIDLTSQVKKQENN